MTAIRVEIHLAEGVALFALEKGCVCLKVCLQLRVARPLGRCDVLGDELHFLPQSVADHGIVPVQAECKGFAVIDLAADVVPDQPPQFVRRWRSLMDPRETLREVFKLPCRNDDFVDIGRARPMQQNVSGEQHRSKQQKV